MVKSCYPALDAWGLKRLVTLSGFTEIFILFFSIWINWKRGFNTKNIQQYIYMLYVSPIQRECQIKILHQSGDMYMQLDQVCCWKDLSSAFIWWSQFFFSFWIFRLKFYFAINLINDVHVAMFYNLGEIQMLGYLD